MHKILKRTAAALATLALIALCAAFTLFKLIQKRIDNHAPHLVARNIPAADLHFQTLDGNPHALSDYKGKVVFLDLWGTWCIQCVAEMPTVQKLYDHYRGDPNVQFLIVSRLDTPTKVERYARINRFDLPFYVTRDQDIPDSMYLHQYPATFLYTKDGLLAAQHAGGANWSDASVIHFIDHLRAN